MQRPRSYHTQRSSALSNPMSTLRSDPAHQRTTSSGQPRYSAHEEGELLQDQRANISDGNTTTSMVSGVSDDHDDNTKHDHTSGTQRFKRQQKAGKASHGHWMSWWSEVTAMCISIAALIAITAFLLKIDKMPLSSWTMPWNVKPATLISILIGIHRIAMSVVLASCLGQLKWVYFQQGTHSLSHFEIFDVASRGAWGGLLLLYNIRWKALIACTGALATILLLAVEPFTQTILYYESLDLVDQHSSAEIQVTKAWDLGTPFYMSQFGTGPEYGQLGYDAITLGLFSGLSNVVGDIMFDCQSGNCTWSTYKTLGVCSHCTDVSADIMESCWNSMTQGSLDENLLGPHGNCTYQTPSGANLSVNYNAEWESEESNYGNISLWTSAISTYNTSAITAISSAWLPSGYVNGTGCSRPNCTFPPPKAYDCAFSWCEQTYSTTQVKMGRLFEPCTSTEDLVFPINYLNDTIIENCIDTNDLPMIAGIPSSQYKPHANSTCDTAWVPPVGTPGTYAINEEDQQNMAKQLREVLVQQLMSYNGSVLAQYLYSANEGNFSQTAGQIALALSKVVREGRNGTTFTDSQVYYTATIIRVEWRWLIYPLALLSISILFMVATMKQARIVWKTSSLAVMFHGPQDLHDDVSPALTQKEMSALAKRTKVKLAADKAGYVRLVSATAAKLES